MRTLLLKVSIASNTISLANNLNESDVRCPQEFVEQIHNDAYNLAELWHEFGNISGAYKPILDDVLSEYSASERHEIKKLIIYYVKECKN